MQVFALFAIFLLGPVPALAAKTKPVVFVRSAQLTELSETLAYPARIEPKIRASILADADGVVSKINTPLGTRVKRGQKLLVITNTDPVYQYAPMAVTAPVAGVVSQVAVTEGSRVARGEKLLLVTDPAQVRVTVEVAAQDLASIRSGLAAEMQVPGQDKPVALKVKGISPFVDPGLGTATCELELAGQGLPLAPGLIGRVTFKVNVRKGYSVPDDAVTFRGKEPFVRVVRDGVAKLVAVTMGRKQAGQIEIVKGLKDGDQVVERASGFISDGEAVQVQAPEEPKSESKG